MFFKRFYLVLLIKCPRKWSRHTQFAYPGVSMLYIRLDIDPLPLLKPWKEIGESLIFRGAYSNGEVTPLSEVIALAKAKANLNNVSPIMLNCCSCWGSLTFRLVLALWWELVVSFAWEFLDCYGHLWNRAPTRMFWATLGCLVLLGLFSLWKWSVFRYLHLNIDSRQPSITCTRECRFRPLHNTILLSLSNYLSFSNFSCRAS